MSASLCVHDFENLRYPSGEKDLTYLSYISNVEDANGIIDSQSRDSTYLVIGKSLENSLNGDR